MELLFLLCSIISTFLTSLALSLLLPFKILITRFRSSRFIADAQSEGVSLYEGAVWHERRYPVRHSFRYSVRYALFDLDRALHSPPDHLSADEARSVADTNGPVFLLTIPPSVGYEQNPLSLYYCYDLDDSTSHLKKCIAEVTNTPWSERVKFVFLPNSDLVAKPLHVSPFMDMLGIWSVKANAPGDSLSVVISVKHPELGDYFVANLKAKRIHSTSVSEHDLFFWLMPHKVALWTYWHDCDDPCPNFEGNDDFSATESRILSSHARSFPTLPYLLSHEPQINITFFQQFAALGAGKKVEHN